MTVELGILWRCDSCLAEVFKRGYGLPNGWVYYPAQVARNLQSYHKCDKCSRENSKMSIKKRLLSIVSAVWSGIRATGRFLDDCLDDGVGGLVVLLAVCVVGIIVLGFVALIGAYVSS